MTKRKNIQVWYHANCYDGFGAAYAFWLKYGDAAQYIPCAYGSKPPPYSKDDEIYIVDFSFPRDQLLEIHAEVKYLLVLDHHKTAEEDLRGLDFCEFDMDRSGAMMAWEYLYDGQAIPLMFKYIQDRDLWKFEYPETKPFQSYLRSVPFDFKIWDEIATKLFHNQGESIFEQGRAIQRFTDSQVEKMCKHSVVLNFKSGVSMAVIPATAFWSEVGHHLLEKHPDAHFAASFSQIDLKGTKEYLWSLRSRSHEDFDVSSVAKLFGGGGHKNAAGCKTPDIETFINR